MSEQPSVETGQQIVPGPASTTSGGQLVPSAPNIEEITRPSPLDNSLSFLYKQAIRLNVPLRFVLVQPQVERESQFIDTFDLEDHQDAIFLTIFQFIRKLLNQDNTVTLEQIWEIVSAFRGDSFNPLEIIPIWIHAIPEFRVENLTILQQVNIYLQNLGEPNQYNNVTEIVTYYFNTWLPRYQNEYQQDLETLVGYSRAQQEIASIEPISHSGITLDTVRVAYDYPTEPGVNPLADIFNAAITSYIIPFIQYNVRPMKQLTEPVGPYYKIYKGRSIDARPDYNNVIITTSQASQGQTVFLNVWTGEDFFDEETGKESPEVYEEARTGKKESFNLVEITYIEDQNLIRVIFSSPHTEEVDQFSVIRRIHAHLPTLPAPQNEAIHEVRISGFFMIYNANLVEVALFHLIMNDPLFNAYLYLEEGGKSFAEKTRLNINYRGASAETGDVTKTYRTESGRTVKKKSKRKAAVSATITQTNIQTGDRFMVQQPDGREQVFSAQQTFPVINVKMTRATSRRVAEQFVNILARLFRRYLEQGRNILNFYLRFVPEYQNVLTYRDQQKNRTVGVPLTTEGGRVIETSRESRVDKLRKYAGDVFLANYARRCQKSFQPELINSTEEEIWKRKYLTRGNTQEERQVLRYPKDSNPPKYYFVCPDDRFPYPGVIDNKTLKNRHIYPYVPCCFKRNQITSTSSGLNRYYYGVQSRQTRTTAPRSSHIIKTDKIVKPERMGLISSQVASFLSDYDDEAGQMLRYGVPRSANSFIHCVAMAREDRGYLTASDQEEYVSRIRANLFKMVLPHLNGPLNPEVLRQELYDMTNEDIMQYATDNDEFFDPLIFYRALELIFDCNIYVFALNDKDHATGRKTSLLQIPRHKYFHAHTPVPEKQVVLILRHWGGEANALEYPQCELIVDRRQDEMIMSFSPSMNELLYPAMLFVSRTLSWQIFEINSQPTLTARMNVYSVMNYQMIFGRIPVIGQIIDTAGKARVFALAPEWGNPEHTQFSPLRIFVNVPPTAPLSVPEFKSEQATNELPPYQRVIELFGQPISATLSTDHRFLTGLWFSIGDIQFGFYCPCQDVIWKEFSQLYPNINQTSELAALTVRIPRPSETRNVNQSPIQRIRYLSKVAKFIEQIVKYLYLVAGRPTDIDTFIQLITYLAPPANRIDSVVLYDVNTIPRILPAGDVATILARLNQISPHIFYQNKLLIYDEQMKEGITYQLKKYAKNIAGLDIPAVHLRQIQGYYTNKDDFNFNPKFEFVLGSLKEYNFWTQIYVPSASLQQRTIQNLKDNIQTQLNPNAFSYQEPYIYQRSGNNAIGSSYDPRDDSFYLIQNVAGGDKLKAVQVTYTWYVEKRNTGFTTEDWLDQNMIPAHVVYRISPGGGVIPQENNTGGQDRFLEILDYGNNLFAAMLPIL